MSVSFLLYLSMGHDFETFGIGLDALVCTVFLYKSVKDCKILCLLAEITNNRCMLEQENQILYRRIIFHGIVFVGVDMTEAGGMQFFCVPFQQCTIGLKSQPLSGPTRS